MITEPTRGVFLSYASQDTEAAQRICDALRAAGIEVWFDQSELRGGDMWDASIRKHIKTCALFIPVISRNTHAREEGYFRLEWKLAVDRSHLMTTSKTFLLPVVIDDTPDDDEQVPDKFRELQWSRLPAGQTPLAFVERVARLLSPEPAHPAAAVRSPTAAASHTAAAPRQAAPSPAASRQTQRVLLLIAPVAIVGVAYFVVDKWWLSKRVAAGTQASTGQSTVAAPIPEKSIAVLPFVDMSEKHDQEYFSDGLAEELIDVLTRVPGLRIPARTSSFSFKGQAVTIGKIAHILGVTHVLEGSVRKSGDRLRITAQLVRADNGFHLWSQTYDRDVHDVFAVQDDIAHAVTEQLKITLLGADTAPSNQTTSSEAHNLYLQARYLTDRDTPADLEHAVLLYQQALALDPNYAPAWAWLAFCHERRVGQGIDTPGAGFAKATEAAKRALAIDPQLPEPYIVLATAHMLHDHDWQAASKALTKGLALDPNNPQAHEAKGQLAVATGRMSDALTHFRHAVEGDPLNMLHRKYLGRALHYAGRPAEAAAVLRHAIELDPQFPGLHYELGRALLMLREPAAALATFQSESDPAWQRFGLPLGYWATHNYKEAQAALAVLVANAAGSEFQVAETYAFLGEKNKSFEWLERARTLDPGIFWMRRNFLLASIVTDPRYDALLRSMGIPPVPKDD